MLNALHHRALAEKALGLEQEACDTATAAVQQQRAAIRLNPQGVDLQTDLRERLGQLDGEWRDVALLERRSATVG